MSVAQYLISLEGDRVMYHSKRLVRDHLKILSNLDYRLVKYYIMKNLIGPSEESIINFHLKKTSICNILK